MKPTAKPNPVRQQILGDLVANKPSGLAKNVSWQSIDVLARRWSPTETALSATTSGRGVRWIK